MEHEYMKPRLIRASAGTGKTYRLALEYIGLMIKYREDLNFEQIVVITFTRKATSEIRQRIIKFLYQLSYYPQDNSDMIESLQQIYPEITIDNEVFLHLKEVYIQIITNKSLLNISTLDGFINQIFKSLIAPYYNIAEYDIDPRYNDNLLLKLYDTLLNDDNYYLLDEIFQNTHNRTISSYDDFIKKLLDERWIFEFYLAEERDFSNMITEGEKALDSLKQSVDLFCSEFELILKNLYSGKPAVDVFPAAWFKVLNEEGASALDLMEKLKKKLNDEEFLKDNYSLITKNGNFWNGIKLFRKRDQKTIKAQMLELQEEVIHYWKKYLFYTLTIPEQIIITKIAQTLYNEYDRIKFRDKVFTYSDLAFYTWKYFRDPENSIIDGHDVINLFYEQLSYRIRFILIDEFQDTSIIQWNIFAPLINELTSGSGAGGVGSAIVVGDEKQAIYAWRSGERDLLVRLAEIINRDFQYSTLKKSYRSSKAVMDLVNGLFMNDKFQSLATPLEWQYENVDTAKEVKGYVHIEVCNLSRDEDSIDFEEAVEQFVIESGFFKDNPAISMKDTAILTRTKKEIDTICGILRKHGISYIDDAGRSIIHHRAVKPIIYLLNWFNNLDFYSLVLFLRSDLVLMPSNQLKPILELFQSLNNNKQLIVNSLYQSFQENIIIKAIAELHEYRSNPLKLIRKSARKFNLIKVFNQESDFVNLQKFIDITADFFTGKKDYTNNLNGYLLYLEDNRENEEFAQAEIQKQDAVKVMTIHKSKGLEFDTVFVILKTNTSGNFGKNLSIFPKFDKSYAKLEKCIFTLNYDKFIEETEYRNLVKTKKRKEYIEDINLWYVALTRAKRNIIGFYTYGNKKADHWDKITDTNDNLDVNKLMISSILSEFKDNCIETEYNKKISFGELEPYTENDDEEQHISRESNIDVSSWFTENPLDNLKEKENWKMCLDQEAMEMQVKAQFRGNIAHYYLQQLEFDGLEARKTALKRTINFYGSLLSVSNITSICNQLNIFLEENSEYFSRDHWDVVLREYAIFKNGNEFRVDRMLVSHKRKEIAILDYKTGGITDPLQLKNYQNIIEQISFVKKNNYKVLTGRFLKISLQD